MIHSNNLMRIVVAGMLFSSISLCVCGQVKKSESKERRKAHFFIGGQAMSYSGDVGARYQKWNAGFQLGLQFGKKKILNGSILLSHGKVSGDNAAEGNNLSTINSNYFSSSITSFGYRLQGNLYKNQFIRCYLGTGFSLFFYNPKDAEGNKLALDESSRNEGEDYGTVSVNFPLYGGVTYYFSNKYGVNLEAGLYNPMTDYIDNVSELGTNSGNDNILYVAFNFLIPIN